MGPEERLSTGNSAAAAALAMVPSLRAMNRGASVPMVGDGVGERLRDVRGERPHRGVQQSGVLASQQSDPPEPPGLGDRGIRVDILEDLGGAGLGAAVERSEHRAERDLAEPGLPDLSSRGSHGLLVERHDGTPVALVAPLDHEDGAPHDSGEPVGPVAKRRQGSAGRQAYPDRGHPRQAGSGEHRVREVGRPDHHPGNTAGIGPSAEYASERRQHPGGHVFRGPGLDLGENLPAAHQHGVRVGAADIHAHASPVREMRHFGSA